MKYIVLVLLVVFSIGAKAQTWGDSSLPDQIIYTAVDKAPVFPGGLRAYHRFIADHLQLPDSSTAPFSGKPASACVIIDSTGKIVFAKIEKNFTDAYNGAILQMISKMPAWTPGYKEGRAVATSLRIPVLFADIDIPVNTVIF